MGHRLRSTWLQGGDGNEVRKSKNVLQVYSALFDREDRAWRAAMIIQGILKARSPRITEVARAIPFWFLVSSSSVVRNP